MMESSSDRLEKGLLIANSDQQQQLLVNHNDDNDSEEEELLYSASFEEEEGLIKLKTMEWILYSFLLVFAWGFGFLMLLFLPLRRYLLRRTIRSQRLSLTPHSIVYNVTKPAAFCLGLVKVDKHVLLHSVSDLVVHQGGYLQSRYGVYSVTIQNATHTVIHIQGVSNPNEFRKAVLTRLSDINNQTYRQHNVASSTPRLSHAPLSPLKVPTHDTTLADFALLQKLDQVGRSLKRVQSLIEDRQQKTTQTKD